MSFTPTQISRAQAIQFSASHDTSAQVRLVAGPGTGKSSSIEERVRWLMENGTSPSNICATSFTRASSTDLRGRIHSYCSRNGLPQGSQVSVTTLHSLALRILRRAGLLTAFPSDPLVLSSWEVENIFDKEFIQQSGIGKTRCEEIRKEHEAFWSTGLWNPPNYIAPDPPITLVERERFISFHDPRVQIYSCVLPGEIIRQCVTHMEAGTLNPVTLIGVQHLIVDEFQDLNPLDQQFIDFFIRNGATVFVAGDDDQSLYSFRFASPDGIRNFPTRYPTAGQRVLEDCFRCTPSILDCAQALISANPGPNRIPKNHVSLYLESNPSVNGIVHRLKFPSGLAEARSIAASCKSLIQNGIDPRDILILLANMGVLSPGLSEELETAEVPFESPNLEGFANSDANKFLLALLRIVCNSDDYVAHRVILGSIPRIGVGTCNKICHSVITSGLNFKNIFYQPLPDGVFVGRALTGINAVKTICEQISQFQPTDDLTQRIGTITSMIEVCFDSEIKDECLNFLSTLPSGINLEELRDYLWTESDEQQSAILTKVYTRLNIAIPDGGVLPQRVRMMTMHGAKGLSAKVVFIPGLEEEIIPGPRRRPFPGLVQEAARLLYVSITRARAACVLSYSRTRVSRGNFGSTTPSRFVTQLNGPFVERTDDLTQVEVQHILNECRNL